MLCVCSISDLNFSILFILQSVPDPGHLTVNFAGIFFSFSRQFLFPCLVPEKMPKKEKKKNLVFNLMSDYSFGLVH